MEKIQEKHDLHKLTIWELAKLLGLLQLNNLGCFINIQRINAHQGIIRSIIFWKSKSNLYIISCGNDKLIKIWDMKTFHLKKILVGHKGPIYKLLTFSYNRTNYLCSSSGDQTIKLWNLKTMKLAKTLMGHTSTPSSLIYIKEKRLLVSGEWDGNIIFWNIKQGSMIMNIRIETNEIWSLYFDVKKNQLIIGSKLTDKLFFYDFDKKKLNHEFNISSFTNPNFVKMIFDINTISIHKDVDDFLVCSGSNNIAIINKDYKLREYYVLKGHTNQVRSFVYSKKLQCLISVGCDKSLRVWKFDYDVLNKKLILKDEKKFDSPHTDNLNCVTIDEEENYMATCAWDGDILIYKF